MVTDGQENEADLSLKELGENLASYEIKLNTLVWQTPQPVDLELRTEANIQVAFVNEGLDLPITINASKSLQAGSSEVVLTDGKALLDKKIIEWDGMQQEIKLSLMIDVASGRRKSWAEHWGLHNQRVLFNPAPIT